MSALNPSWCRGRVRLILQRHGMDADQARALAEEMFPTGKPLPRRHGETYEGESRTSTT